MAFPSLSPPSQDVGLGTKEPLSFPATPPPPHCNSDKGIPCVPVSGQVLVTKWWRVWGRVGEGESQDQKRRHLLTLKILVHPQSSETSSLSPLWLPSTMETEAGGLICI